MEARIGSLSNWCFLWLMSFLNRCSIFFFVHLWNLWEGHADTVFVLIKQISFRFPCSRVKIQRFILLKRALERTDPSDSEGTWGLQLVIIYTRNLTNFSTDSWADPSNSSRLCVLLLAAVNSRQVAQMPLTLLWVSMRDISTVLRSKILKEIGVNGVDICIGVYGFIWHGKAGTIGVNTVLIEFLRFCESN